MQKYIISTRKGKEISLIILLSTDIHHLDFAFSLTVNVFVTTYTSNENIYI